MRGEPVSYAILPTGLPATGKTSVTNAIAQALEIPTIRADSIKEAIFDSVGYSTLHWSEFLTTVSTEVALRMLPQVGSCVFDVFLSPEEARQELLPQVDHLIEIHCSAPYEVAWQRFVERARSGHRHPGHLDADVPFDFFESSLMAQGVDKPFDLGSSTLTVDSTRDVDIIGVVDWVRRCIESRPENSDHRGRHEDPTQR